MTGRRGRRQNLAPGPRWALAFALLMLVLYPQSLSAEERAQLFVTRESGFGRLVLSFTDRPDLPPYQIRHENGVLAIQFEEPLNLPLPDVGTLLGEFISIARLDPDRKAIRFGLSNAFGVNWIEAGERLFIDLLPSNWTGLPPSLPQSVLTELTERAKQAEVIAEQRRKAEEARALKPQATVRVGRNPTFVRVQFEWTEDTKATFTLEENIGRLTFDWPVAIDLYPLKADMPDELVDATPSYDETGSLVEFALADGVVPRFFEISSRQFIVDIDIDKERGLDAALVREMAEENARRLAEEERKAQSEKANAAEEQRRAAQTTITPTVSIIGSTVRMNFPFEQDTPAAVFRRGNTIWMIFDTPSSLAAPPRSDALAAIADDVRVVPAGDTKIMRLDLSQERLATLGSEGRAWVLSLGDVLLNPTEPVTLRRNRLEDGRMQMLADLQRPHRVHEFRDPDVGDILKVVTAFPPARGVSRGLDFVEFDLMRSVHGLVVRAENEELEVEVAGTDVVLGTDAGLVISALDSNRVLDSGHQPQFRQSYVDFASLQESDPALFVSRRESLLARAAQSEGRLRDVARLELAQYYVANHFSYEALGVLGVMEASQTADDLRRRVRLVRGIANTMAARPAEALSVFNSDGFVEEADALMWRSLAKGQLGDFAGVRADAAIAESVIDSYPGWVRSRFLINAARAAIETNDPGAAVDLMEKIDFASLDIEQVTEYQLLQARIAAGEKRVNEALDTYGLVIAADIRPTRAEAVYRTLLLLQETGRIDVEKATQTLSAEVLMWRGNALEASMQGLLAELYFGHKAYRQGFETVRQAVAHYPDNRSVDALLARAQAVFAELYLDGRADELDPVEALSLFYDFRQLTPPGARGDEMIRNLARRLVKLDLLTQAGDLLEYQIDNRLKGVAQAQVALDLAIIRIADRAPEGALRVLNRTRLVDLPPQLERQRRILEARSLIDAGRQDLALDLLSRIKGRDADLLRVEGLWKSRNYGAAAELMEIVYTPRPDGGQLPREVRMGIVRAAVGFALAGDRLGLDRLRMKFSEIMATTPEWPMFEYVTGDAIPTSVEFRTVAREVSGLDSLNAFLETYRVMYNSGDALTPSQVAATTGT